MDKGRILVTGSSGFIGSHTARLALARGYTVTGLDTAESIVPGIDAVSGDIRDRDTVSEAMKGADYVIHLAAVTVGQEFEKDPKACYSVNVSGFMNVLDAACRQGVKKFVYASTAYVYQDEFKEDTVIDIAKQRNHYAKSKIINEMLAKSYGDIYDTSIMGLRFFNVYGEGEKTKGPYTSIITKFLECDQKGEPLELYGDGTQAKDMVNVEDASKIALALMQKGKHSIYNVGTGRPIPYKEIAELINPSNIKYVPNPLSTYQYYTKADTARLLDTLHGYEFIDTREWIKKHKGPRYAH